MLWFGRVGKKKGSPVRLGELALFLFGTECIPTTFFSHAS
jgi:hypothetical protein